MKTVNDIPGLKEILQECQQKVTTLLGRPVVIHYSMTINSVPYSQLAAIICQVCSVTWKSILDHDRKANVVIARQLFCYFASEVLHKQVTEIGRIIGKDHTTVIHGRGKIRNMIDTEDDLYCPIINEVQGLLDQILVPIEQPA